jgi:DNA-binding NarL/FixJ family response regulator
LHDALEAINRSTYLARRFNLYPILGIGLVLHAEIHALEGRDAAAETDLRDALHVAGNHPDVLAAVHGQRANIALLHDDIEGAARELEAAMDIVRQSPSMSPHPLRGLWALLAAVLGSDGLAACEELRKSGATVQRVNAGYLHYAESTILGQQQRYAEAVTAFAQAADAMRDMPWYRNGAQRLAAQAALHDGWGDPVGWLREALSWYVEYNMERPAAACRALLRRAGAPVPRRGRGESDVPPHLRAKSVTSREMDVLRLVAEGRSNRQIGERLYLSPRTIERHIENLTSKLGLQGRKELKAFATARSQETVSTTLQS